MASSQTEKSQTMTTDRSFSRAVAGVLDMPLKAQSIETLQVNIGLRCNLACRHCHVLSSPKRTEEMSWETMEAVLAELAQHGHGSLGR